MEQGWAYMSSRVILIEKSFRYPIVHVPMLISLLHWFQNTFCFLCSSTPSHGGSFFGTMVDLEGENGPKKAKFLNWLKTHPKVLNA